MIKAVIFDLDGTLADTLNLSIDAVRAAVKPLLGRELPTEEITATFGPSEEGTFLALCPDQYGQALENYYEQYAHLHYQVTEPFPGIAELLKWLAAKGIQLGLVTGKGRRPCEMTLGVFGLQDTFGMVVTGNPAGPNKVEGITAVRKHFGLTPEECIYVGDSPIDIIQSKEAGVRVVGAAWAPEADIAALTAQKPDWLFTSIEEFRKFLENLIP